MTTRTLRIALLGSLIVFTPAMADVFNAIYEQLELSPQLQAELERAACTPHRVSMKSSEGLRAVSFIDEERVRDEDTSFDATALCETHAYIDTHPAAFEVSCSHQPGTWTCEPPQQTLDVKFADRRIVIRAENVSLQDAYDVIAHFVQTRAFEPGTHKDDSLRRISGPYDDCNVRSFEPDVFVFDCQNFGGRVRRTGTSWQLL